MKYKYYILSIAIISYFAIAILLFMRILEYQNIFLLIGTIILLASNVSLFIYITCNIFITNSSEGEP